MSHEPRVSSWLIVAVTGAGAGAMAGANKRVLVTYNRALLKYDRAFFDIFGWGSGWCVVTHMWISHELQVSSWLIYMCVALIHVACHTYEHVRAMAGAGAGVGAVHVIVAVVGCILVATMAPLYVLPVLCVLCHFTGFARLVAGRSKCTPSFLLQSDLCLSVATMAPLYRVAKMHRMPPVAGLFPQKSH